MCVCGCARGTLIQSSISTPSLLFIAFNPVGAQNEGDLRLVGFEATRLAGRLELFRSNTWYTICNDYFSLATTNVACRQLGLGYAVKPPIDNDAESKRLGYHQDPKNSRFAERE